jgi:hypothetical protein
MSRTLVASVFFIIGLALILIAAGHGLPTYPGAPSANGATCGGLAIAGGLSFVAAAITARPHTSQD